MLILCVGIAVPAHAQSGTLSLGWDQPLLGTQTLADVQAFKYMLAINGAVPVAMTATCVTGSGAPSCTAGPIPGLKSGDVLILTASNGLGSGSSDPLTIGSGASKPINVTVIVKVTVP